MLFSSVMSFQRMYTQINIEDFMDWSIRNGKPNKIDIKLINEYLKGKNFLGYVIRKQNRFIILSSNKEPLKMFIDLNSMLNYLQLKANTIEKDFKGYKVKALKMCPKMA